MSTKTEAPRCPRCGGYIPSNRQPGAHPGAISRWDNATELCSRCGTDEAVIQTFGNGQEGLHPLTGAKPWTKPPMAPVVATPKGASTRQQRWGRIVQWLAEHPGAHRPRDIGEALGITTHQTAKDLAQMAEKHDTVDRIRDPEKPRSTYRYRAN